MSARHAIGLCGIALFTALSPRAALAQSDPRAVIIGSWRGTSTCTDMAFTPACHNEVVIYDVRRAASADSVILHADKVVNGVREDMGEFTLGPAANGDWIGDIVGGRFHGRFTLHIAGPRMTGALVDVPTGRRVRDVALTRQPS